MAKFIKLELRTKEDKDKGLTAIGQIAILRAGSKKIRCFIHKDTNVVTHAASGCKIANFETWMLGTKFNKRKAAQVAIAAIINKIGETKFWEAVNKEPIINND